MKSVRKPDKKELDAVGSPYRFMIEPRGNASCRLPTGIPEISPPNTACGAPRRACPGLQRRPAR